MTRIHAVWAEPTDPPHWTCFVPFGQQRHVSGSRSSSYGGKPDRKVSPFKMFPDVRYQPENMEFYHPMKNALELFWNSRPPAVPYQRETGGSQLKGLTYLKADVQDGYKHLSLPQTGSRHRPQRGQPQPNSESRRVPRMSEQLRSCQHLRAPDLDECQRYCPGRDITNGGSNRRRGPPQQTGALLMKKSVTAERNCTFRSICSHFPLEASRSKVLETWAGVLWDFQDQTQTDRPPENITEKEQDVGGEGFSHDGCTLTSRLDGRLDPPES